MFPVQKSRSDSDEKQLLKAFARLNEEGRRSLLDYAEFLAERSPEPEVQSMARVEIARPEEESVIAAIKRLSATYPMLDPSLMLHETSGLMSQHLIQGREAVEVIDELELLFTRYYEKACGDSSFD